MHVLKGKVEKDVCVSVLLESGNNRGNLGIAELRQVRVHVLAVASPSHNRFTHLVLPPFYTVNTFSRDMAPEELCTACSWTTERCVVGGLKHYYQGAIESPISKREHHCSNPNSGPGL